MLRNPVPFINWESEKFEILDNWSKALQNYMYTG